MATGSGSGSLNGGGAEGYTFDIILSFENEKDPGLPPAGCFVDYKSIARQALPPYPSKLSDFAVFSKLTIRGAVLY